MNQFNLANGDLPRTVTIIRWTYS